MRSVISLALNEYDDDDDDDDDELWPLLLALISVHNMHSTGKSKCHIFGVIYTPWARKGDTIALSCTLLIPNINWF